MLGHVVEYYDFAVYALLAPVLAQVFFPSDNELNSLLATLGVFGVAYFVRPLGGLLFGHLGDRIGRRNTLLAVILLMAGATTAMGLLPTYNQGGLVAPILLIVCRSLQGLSAGGEYGGSASFVAEHAPPGRRGFFTSWLHGSTGIGLTLGALTALVLSAVVSQDALESWAWRLPFLLALPLGLVGLYLRLRLDDTPAFEAAKKAGTIPKLPLVEAVRLHWRAILTIAGMVLLLTVSLYVSFTYVTTYLKTFLDVPLSRSLPAGIAGMLTFFVLAPVFGALSDRVGRKPVLAGAAVGHIIGIYPAFLLLQNRSFVAILFAYLILGTLYAGYVGPFTAAVTERFPANVRAASLGIGYQLPVCVFGGLSPLILTYLTDATGVILMPAYYVIGAAVISLLVTLLMTETAGKNAVELDAVVGTAHADRLGSEQGADENDEHRAHQIR
ncbi:MULTISPECIES: MFS transporter [Rhodococcus]|uniref:MFS transporter n=1 Tax=Rhodococcus jostii TaxID=132919 RepID=A0ABU4CJ36_RHOJO|nr:MULTISPECIES: MFS transporter [Rhodococcus]MDI9976756.1 MFS transporter [Rhodococcus sp. IEGM 1307]MDV6283579.1 MFS transporter [Rhodococcus jostii]